MGWVVCNAARQTQTPHIGTMRGMPKPRRTASPAAHVGFAVLAAQVAPGATEVQLTPAGEFRADDGSGRPDDIEGGKPWVMNGGNAPLVIARGAAQVNDFVIDYEHQTLYSKTNGQKAPAAGWWKTMEWREGVGLFATDVRWTPAATEAIKNSEYRYISAVFYYDLKTGEVLAMRMAALTNTPGLDGMQPLAALTAQMGANWVDPCRGAGGADDAPTEDDEEDRLMDLLKKLLAALGLAETTTAEVALTAVTALKAKADADGQALAALKAQPPAGGAPDPAKFVPIETYTAAVAQLAALTAQGESADALIAAAEKDGKVLPTEKGWLLDMSKGAGGVAALKAHLGARQPIPALVGMQSQAALTQQHSQQGGQGGAPDAIGLAVCSQLGLTPEQYAAGAVASKK